jgi:hypothetical protein
MTLTPWNVAIGVILLCGIACDLHAQAAVDRFGSPLQRRLPQTIITSSQSPTPMKEVSKADIAIAIENDIDNERKKSNDKKYHVNYRGKDLALALIRIHDDPLSSLGGGKYFACADMKAADSIIYDIDFFYRRTVRQHEGHRNFCSQSKRETALQLERRRRRVEKAAASLKAGTVALPLWWAGHCATLD